MNPRSTILAAFVEHEWRTQLRSPRFLAIAAAYLVLSILPPWTLFRLRERFLSAPDIADVTAASLPALTVLMTAALSYDAVSREHVANAFNVTSLTPISSAGYLIRRWIALLTLILPLTVAGPLSGVAATINADIPMASFTIFAYPWLVHVIPLAIVVSAIAIASGTIARSLIGAAILLLLVLNVLLSSIGWIFDQFGATLPDTSSFFGIDGFAWVRFYENVFGQGHFWDRGMTDHSLAGLIDFMIPRAIIPFGLALLLLAAASVYLSRTQADLKPLRIRADHPLRSYLRLWNSFRVFIRPDGSPGWHELGFIAVATLFLTGAAIYSVEREHSYEALAESRYLMETSGAPQPTSPALIPRIAELKGDVDANGTVSTRGSIVFDNTGDAGVGRLALTIHPDIEIHRLTADGKPIVWNRTLERVWGDLPVIVDSGRSVRVEFELSGAPSDVHFPWRSSRGSFVAYWERLIGSQWRRSLANSYRRPRVNEILTTLTPEMLLPLPRYTTWELPPPPKTSDEPSGEIPEEVHLVDTRIEIDLDLPFRAIDTCGNISTGLVLRGTCQSPLHSFSVVGGRLSIIEGEQSRIVALKDFEHLGRFHLVALEEAAWRGLDGWDEDPGEEKQIWLLTGSSTDGNFVNIPPWMLAGKEVFRSDDFAKSVFAHRLLRQRLVTPDEGVFFRALYQSLGMIRSSRRATATLPMVPIDQTPPIRNTRWRAERQLEPVMLWLIYRIGSTALFDGVKEFLTRSGPGTARELFNDIGSKAEEPLHQFYEDFIESFALPRLALEDLVVAETSSGWRVRGAVRNSGTGEASCPVVLFTDVDRFERRVVVSGGQIASFEITSSQLPRTVEIDPDERCYRLAGAGLATRWNLQQ